MRAAFRFTTSKIQRLGRRALRLPMLLAVLLLVHFASTVLAEQRFPPPDFESGHKVPEPTVPAARALWLEYGDMAVLAGLLGLTTWLVYKKRSRRAIVAVSIFSLLYFGFWRYGCICAIGSVQNVALALFEPGYGIPVAALAFFVLPLVFTLFGGRSFCAGVCPHGALQDLVLLKPIKVPGWLEQGLGILPYIYLGAGVLFAATGSAFIICQYDPFVPIFRMNGRTLMVASGIALLLLGMFVGRPYCRFLCPFGALLKLGSVVSKWRVRVTPDYCTQCRLCEASCPFGAMRLPQAAAPAAGGLRADRRRLAITLALVPVLLAGGGLLGYKFSGPASLMHPDVSLAERVIREKDVPSKTGVLSPDDLALERGRQNESELLSRAVQIRQNFEWGATLFGLWVGLVIAVKLLSLALHRQRTDYEPDRGDCVSCARCFEYCPNELVRRGVIPVAAAGAAETKPVERVAQARQHELVN